MKRPTGMSIENDDRLDDIASLVFKDVHKFELDNARSPTVAEHRRIYESARQEYDKRYDPE